MCGFAGFFPSISEEKDNAILRSMLARIKYRGPDNTSTFRNNKIALGHHRLSIIDLKGGNQPAVDKDLNDCLVLMEKFMDTKMLLNKLKGRELN